MEWLLGCKQSILFQDRCSKCNILIIIIELTVHNFDLWGNSSTKRRGHYEVMICININQCYHVNRCSRTILKFNNHTNKLWIIGIIVLFVLFFFNFILLRLFLLFCYFLVGSTVPHEVRLIFCYLRYAFLQVRIFLFLKPSNQNFLAVFSSKVDNLKVACLHDDWTGSNFYSSLFFSWNLCLCTYWEVSIENDPERVKWQA